MSLEGPNTHGSAYPDPGLRIQLFTKKTFRFQFSRLKKPENRSLGIPKTLNSSPKFFKNDVHEKSFFATLSMRQQRFGRPKRRKCELEIAKKMT